MNVLNEDLYIEKERGGSIEAVDCCCKVESIEGGKMGCLEDCLNR